MGLGDFDHVVDIGYRKARHIEKLTAVGLDYHSPWLGLIQSRRRFAHRILRENGIGHLTRSRLSEIRPQERNVAQQLLISSARNYGQCLQLGWRFRRGWRLLSWS